MDYREFIALNRGLRSILEKKNPGTQIDVGMDASAFHGQHGAQVALLQSPILRAAQSFYIGTENFRGPPVDKPHTRHPRLKLCSLFNFDTAPALQLFNSSTIQHPGLSCSFVVTSKTEIAGPVALP